ncbi:hypothetical protein GMRT_11378 [Giardia muris]|uniref:Uncharacterized protein n=1 Tax=Giardia muris TaxID=5742 RepID=A0A4Z1T3Y1_GIAMU|nr:hypothetical protein GMRT_11378 [Giardia muris]|eukprot:TNJ30358.1 hypothetical protein GMRT_11378 [Giardia muris]
MMSLIAFSVLMAPVVGGVIAMQKQFDLNVALNTPTTVTLPADPNPPGIPIACLLSIKMNKVAQLNVSVSIAKNTPQQVEYSLTGKDSKFVYQELYIRFSAETTLTFTTDETVSLSGLLEPYYDSSFVYLSSDASEVLLHQTFSPIDGRVVVFSNLPSNTIVQMVACNSRPGNVLFGEARCITEQRLLDSGKYLYFRVDGHDLEYKSSLTDLLTSDWYLRFKIIASSDTSAHGLVQMSIAPVMTILVDDLMAIPPPFADGSRYCSFFFLDMKNAIELAPVIGRQAQMPYTLSLWIINPPGYSVNEVCINTEAKEVVCRIPKQGAKNKVIVRFDDWQYEAESKYILVISYELINHHQSVQSFGTITAFLLGSLQADQSYTNLPINTVGAEIATEMRVLLGAEFTLESSGTIEFNYVDVGEGVGNMSYCRPYAFVINESTWETVYQDNVHVLHTVPLPPGLYYLKINADSSCFIPTAGFRVVITPHKREELYTLQMKESFPLTLREGMAPTEFLYNYQYRDGAYICVDLCEALETDKAIVTLNETLTYSNYTSQPGRNHTITFTRGTYQGTSTYVMVESFDTSYCFLQDGRTNSISANLMLSLQEGVSELSAEVSVRSIGALKIPENIHLSYMFTATCRPIIGFLTHYTSQIPMTVTYNVHVLYLDWLSDYTMCSTECGARNLIRSLFGDDVDFSTLTPSSRYTVNISSSQFINLVLKSKVNFLSTSECAQQYAYIVTYNVTPSEEPQFYFGFVSPCIKSLLPWKVILQLTISIFITVLCCTGLIVIVVLLHKPTCRKRKASKPRMKVSQSYVSLAGTSIL